MEIGTLVEVTAVVIALGLGTSSLIQTKSIQKKQNRQKFLDEIVEWAIDCAKFVIGLNQAEVMLEPLEAPRFLRESWAAEDFLNNNLKQLEQFQALRARSAYVAELLPPDANLLRESVNKVVDALRKQLAFLNEYKRAGPSKSIFESAKPAYQLNIEIYGKAIDICKEAALIKKKDL